ncbi:MAG: AMP-binding protein [Proteobacteria bacterium]|nr:AMP-binding protein [Pseudomonadota bacterium]
MLLDALRAAPPGAVALVDGRRTISYGALPALIEREIEWLREGGAERHAVLADNGVPWALADLALHVGAMLSVPLPGSFTPAQVAHALDDAGIDALLTDDDVRARELLPGWRLDGSSPVSGLHRFRRQLDPATRPLLLSVPARSRTPRAALRTRRACVSRVQRWRRSRSRWLGRRVNSPSNATSASCRSQPCSRTSRGCMRPCCAGRLASCHRAQSRE